MGWFTLPPTSVARWAAGGGRLGGSPNRPSAPPGEAPPMLRRAAAGVEAASRRSNRPGRCRRWPRRPDSTRGSEDDDEFHPAEPPTDADVARLLATVRRRVQRLLARRGLDGGDASGAPPDPFSEEAPALA